MKRSKIALWLSIIAITFCFGACAKKQITPIEQILPPVQKEEITTPPIEQITPPVEEKKVVETEPEIITLTEDVIDQVISQEEIKQPEETTKEVLSPLQQKMLAFEAKDAYFEFDDFSLSTEAKKVIIDLSSFLMENPSLKVRIEGHCDERGTTEYNLALGERRAKSVQDYLIFLGVRPEIASVISYGEEKPVDPRSCEEAWALNRRAHFDISE
jgi:peptidoglycan-associated lipoprotein